LRRRRRPLSSRKARVRVRPPVCCTQRTAQEVKVEHALDRARLGVEEDRLRLPREQLPALLHLGALGRGRRRRRRGGGGGGGGGRRRGARRRNGGRSFAASRHAVARARGSASCAATRSRCGVCGRENKGGGGTWGVELGARVGRSRRSACALPPRSTRRRARAARGREAVVSCATPPPPRGLVALPIGGLVCDRRERAGAAGAVHEAGWLARARASVLPRSSSSSVEASATSSPFVRGTLRTRLARTSKADSRLVSSGCR
jgi:hypothetical protein